MSKTMDAWYVYILVGLVCGVFSAFFGVGAGIIMVPTMVLAFGFPQKSAQGLALAVMVPMALTGAIRYKLNPHLDFSLGLAALLSVGAVVGALVGSGVVAKAPTDVLRKLFAVVLLVAAARMLLAKAPDATKGPAAGGPASGPAAVERPATGGADTAPAQPGGKGGGHVDSAQ